LKAQLSNELDDEVLDKLASPHRKSTSPDVRGLPDSEDGLSLDMEMSDSSNEGQYNEIHKR